jgi:hypothetical protein
MIFHRVQMEIQMLWQIPRAIGQIMSSSSFLICMADAEFIEPLMEGAVLG